MDFQSFAYGVGVGIYFCVFVHVVTRRGTER